MDEEFVGCVVAERSKATDRSTVVSFAGWSTAVAAMSADTVIYYNSLHNTYAAEQKTTTLVMTVFEEKHSLGVLKQPNISSTIEGDVEIHNVVTGAEYSASVSLQSLALVLSFIEMVLAFTSATVSICGLRTRQHIPGAVLYQTPIQQVVVLRQGFHLEQRRDGSLVVVHTNTGGHQVDPRYRPEMEEVTSLHDIVPRNLPSTHHHHHHHGSRVVTLQIGDANDSQSRMPDITSHHHQVATAPPMGRYDQPPAYSAVIDTSEIPLNL
ncbi:uncharacterized protein LOC144346438 [Saccoglossus kowalevskii]